MTSPLAERLARLVTERPVRVLLAALAVTLVALPLALRLRLDTNVYDMFPRDRPVASAFARFSRTFIAEPIIEILVESSDPGRLTAFVDPFATELAKSPRIGDVRHRLTGEAARFFRDHLLAFLDEHELDILRERTEPAALRAQLQRIRGLLSGPGGSSLAPILTADPLELLPLVGKRLGAGVAIDASSGLFKSADGRALLVHVRPKAPGSRAIATRELLAEIEGIAARSGGKVTDGNFSGGAGVELSFIGPSIYAMYYEEWLHRDMMLSTIFSFVSVLLLFGVFFRGLRVLPLVGLPLVIGVVWTGAAAELLFARVNAVSLAFAAILIAIGIDLPIQLYNRLREELVAHPPREAIRRAVARFAGPALLATLGPAAVFLACVVSRFSGLRELGALAALGLVVNCIAMLTIFPALLAVVPARVWGARAVPLPTGGPFRALGRLAARRPGAILGVGLVLFGVGLPFALRVRFDEELFAQPPLMPPTLVQKELEQRFGESDNATIAYYEAHGSDPAAVEEDALVHSDRWLAEAERLRAAGSVRTYRSLSMLLPSGATQRTRRARLDAMAPAGRAQALRQALTDLDADPAPFEPFIAQLEAPYAPITVAQLPGELDFLVRLHLHREPGEARIATMLYAASGAGEPEALAAIERVAEGPAGGVVTGRPLFDPMLREVAQTDMLKATGLAALLVAALVIVVHRRWRPILAILVPLSLAWVLFGAALTVFAIPLNLFSLLAVPLVIGYGIDDHVFLLDRFLEGGGRDVGDSLASTGRAIVVTSLTTMAGFLPIAFARFPALRLLGLSGALAVGFCLLAAFAILPPLLVVLFRGRPPEKDVRS